MSEFEMVVGLEVHCQLATKTKLFCGCGTDGFGALANTRVCPVCTGQPGVLPVLNKKAVELAFQAGLALECRLAEQSIFARKNYFYPDLPKAYQISQYEQPFARDGGLELRLKNGPKRIRIHRIHMEEDAGKLLHEIGSLKIDGSLVDFNRGGVPLIEIVTEPDIRGSEEAYAYLTGLKEVLQYAGVSRCDMEKGEMRCDANVSVRPLGSPTFGTRVEIKNLNSFKNVKDALEYEFYRQIEAVKSHEKIVQETRLWDADQGSTHTMRSKEEAHDYRYFPDPDLVPLNAEPVWVGLLKAALPELPAARRSRMVAQFGLSDYDAEVLTGDQKVAAFYDATMKALPPAAAKTAANIIQTELLGKLKASGLEIQDSPVTPPMIASLVGLAQSNAISSKGVKDVFAKSWETRQDPKALVEQLGLSQVSDEGQIRSWVKDALAANPKAVEDLRGGKQQAIGSIVGAVMKLSKGKANPALVNKLIKEAVQG